MLRATEGGEDPDATFLVDHLTSHNNEITDPKLKGISREIASNGLIPQPREGSMAYYNAAATPSDDFFTAVDYRGAFKYDNWAAEWTAVDEYGYFGEFDVIGINDYATNDVAALGQNYPNPFRNTTTFDVSLEDNAVVNMYVCDMTGKVVQIVINNAFMTEGTHAIPVSGLKPGAYTCILSVEGRTASRRMIVTP